MCQWNKCRYFKDEYHNNGYCKKLNQSGSLPYDCKDFVLNNHEAYYEMNNKIFKIIREYKLPYKYIKNLIIDIDNWSKNQLENIIIE